MGCWVDSPSQTNTISGPSKLESQDFWRNQSGRGRKIPRYPRLDFSKVPAKVNCRMTPKTGDENNKVSGAVACRVLQMEARNSPLIGWKFWFKLLQDVLLLVSCLYLGHD
jgi:hypothetical protein